MPTAIQPNGTVGKRSKRVNDLKRLRNILQDLKDAETNWATLTAGQKDTATRKCINAVAKLLDNAIEEIKRREGG
jgi:hypothetical protein